MSSCFHLSLPLKLWTSSPFYLCSNVKFTDEAFHEHPFLKLQLSTPSIPCLLPALFFFPVPVTNTLYILIIYHVKNELQVGEICLYSFINISLVSKLTILFNIYIYIYYSVMLYTNINNSVKDFQKWSPMSHISQLVLGHDLINRMQLFNQKIQFPRSGVFFFFKKDLLGHCHQERPGSEAWSLNYQQHGKVKRQHVHHPRAVECFLYIK